MVALPAVPTEAHICRVPSPQHVELRSVESFRMLGKASRLVKGMCDMLSARTGASMSGALFEPMAMQFCMQAIWQIC